MSNTIKTDANKLTDTRSMPQQRNALEHNPNQLALTEIVNFDRIINANTERVWENVLDWEHLAWLHDTSFDYNELDAAGEWGWRVWSDSAHKNHIELCVNRDQSTYVARSYLAGEQISEIWTTITANNGDTSINVSINAPNIDIKKLPKLSAIYLNLYTQLWDEDEQMMIRRQAKLSDRSHGPDSINLGALDALEAEKIVKLGRHEWQIRKSYKGIEVYAANCPHLLGPLGQNTDNQVVCPWHGYRFDIISGKCVFPEHAKCRLPQPPTVAIIEGQVSLSLVV
jgi:nitrite reductase/ring-hydroxylating ferredoxin subunit